MTSDGVRRWSLRRGRWAAVLALLAGVIAACGGGVGTGGTGSFAVGPITGFGSIVVNGVHYDESSARIEADDGSARTPAELRLGMIVEVDAGEVRDRRAQAQQVRVVSELAGRVDAVDAAASDLRVNGQQVRVNAATVFDDRFAGGLAAVGVGSEVEVYGFAAAGAGALLATRIEPRTAAASFKFRGPVWALDTVSRTFRIGNQTFSYAALSPPPGALSDGALVRVEVGALPDPLGRWVVTALAPQKAARDDADEAEISGLITAFASSAEFRVGGMSVDASAADIAGGPLAAGLRVKVEGRLRAGVLAARKVSVEAETGSGSFELEGTVSQLDTAARTFRVAGSGGARQLVSYARPDVEFVDGSVDDLAPGRRVEVRGALSADGTRIDATRIEFEN